MTTFAHTSIKMHFYLAAAPSKTEGKGIFGLERASVLSLGSEGKQPTVVPGIPETPECRAAG